MTKSALSWLHWLAYQDFRGLLWPWSTETFTLWTQLFSHQCWSLLHVVRNVQIYSLWLPWETNQMLLALYYFSKKYNHFNMLKCTTFVSSASPTLSVALAPVKFDLAEFCWGWQVCYFFAKTIRKWFKGDIYWHCIYAPQNQSHWQRANSQKCKLALVLVS